jgi:type III pantothenate kinase
LPAVEICRPATVLGRSTVESIQSGLFHGTLATVRTLAGAIAEEQFNGRTPVVLGTGGFGRLFAQEKLFDAFIPELALLGLRRAVALATP